MENIARSSSPTGPYEMYPGNPLITNRSTHLTLQAIGHCDCAHFDADRTLMVFHGTRNNDEYPAQGWLGREPYGVWFTWKDGWPDLADQSYDCPLDGCGEALEHEIAWITPSIDKAHRFTMNDAGSHITVTAARQDFGLEVGAPMIGTRQTDFRCAFTATIADPTQLVSGTAGIAIYANANHYMTIAVHAAEADTVAIDATVHNAGLISRVGGVHVPAGGPVRLIVRGDDYGYTFAVGTASDETTLGNVPGKVLSFTNAGGFTGILLGVYAHGDGVVDFNEVHYQAGSGVADE